MLDAIRKRLPGKFGKKKIEIPVVRMSGVIEASPRFNNGISLSLVGKPLEKAFKMKDAPAVAIIINSPGGSPVQSRLVYLRIRALAEEHKKPVLVFVEDVAASGGYMIAIAGDEIFVDPSSIVGSIGVVSAGFGFTQLIEKIGVDRRVYTAGEKKVTLDPFGPENEMDVAHLRAQLEDVHEVFIDMVKERRGDVLNSDEDLFSGMFWTGKTARDFGLVDAVGDVRSVVKQRFGKDAELKFVTAPSSFLARRLGMRSGQALASDRGLAGDVVAELDARALWSRFGL